jgi:DNA-binding NarL/FixJ family response regulator
MNIFLRGREQALKELIEDKKILTFREFHRIIRPIAEGKTTEQIAADERTSVSRIHEIRKEILSKLKRYFAKDFYGIDNAIEFLQAEGLIDRRQM